MIKSEEEIIRTAERAVGGRTIVEVMQQIKYLKEEEQKRHNESVPIATPSLPTIQLKSNNPTPQLKEQLLSRAEKRKAAKRKWYQNK